MKAGNAKGIERPAVSQSVSQSVSTECMQTRDSPPKGCNGQTCIGSDPLLDVGDTGRSQDGVRCSESRHAYKAKWMALPLAVEIDVVIVRGDGLGMRGRREAVRRIVLSMVARPLPCCMTTFMQSTVQGHKDGNSWPCETKPLAMSR